MPTDAESRLHYLASVIDTLWPAGGRTPQLVVLPSRGKPRLLVPVHPRRAGAAAALRYTSQQPFRDRLASVALAGAVRMGWCSILPPVRSRADRQDAESIDDHLSAVLGTPVVTALALTGPRANRKPVLQVFDPRGRTIAFVKVGVGPLTRGLVEAEASALQTLGGLDLEHVTPPRVLHYGTWNGNSVLAMTALPSGSWARDASPLLDRAMHEISHAAHIPAAADYWTLIQRRLTVGTDSHAGIQRGQWLEVFEAVRNASGELPIAVGSWHGDWTRWNCAAHRGAAVVWDWERFATGVPLGFDKLHFAMNVAVGPRRDRFREAAHALVDGAPDLLAPWRLGRAAARTTALLYILELALRYLLDGAPRMSVGSRIEAWAYPTVRSALVAAGERR